MHLLRKLAPALLLLVLPVGILGCDNACVALSKKICECEPSTMLRQQCNRRVDNEARQNKASQEELEQCETFLDTCTCERLDAGDLPACGLAVE